MDCSKSKVFMKNDFKKYVQYGAGWIAPSEWINYDASPTLRFERIPIIGKLYTRNQERFPLNVLYGDIVVGLPLSEKSVDGLYCSHVLEHLAYSDLQMALKNSYQILKFGGIFRLVLPDLECEVRKYLESSDINAANKFMKETGLGYEFRLRGLRGMLLGLLGNSQHLWMWDYKSLTAELEKVGFTKIRRASFNDSIDQMFESVEVKERWQDALGIECYKQ